MPLNESTSTVASLGLAVLTFSSMQMFKQTFQSSQLMTILGGFIGSFVFVFLLTALGNLERVVFGKGFQSQWIEVILCLGTAVMASASVHRVAASTCFLFSLGMMYGMNKIAQDEYGVPGPTNAPVEKSKKRK